MYNDARHILLTMTSGENDSFSSVISEKMLKQ